MASRSKTKAASVLIMVWLAVACSPDDGEPAAVETDVPADMGAAPDVATEPDIPPEPVYACEKRAKCNREFCDRVLIPQGEFIMGTEHPPRTDSHFPSGDERPPHLVSLDAYCIDKYEVSLERYEDCVDAGMCSPAGLKWTDKTDKITTTVNHYPNICYPDLNVCKNRAVNGKTYFQARNYCEWLGSRLCTEAEWERAASGPGPIKHKHPWGDGPPTSARVNIPSVGSGFIDPVDSHPDGASPEGVFNMASNVYEWTRDAYDMYEPAPNGEALHNPLTLPTSPDQKVVGRGSCFFTEPGDTVSERSLFWNTFDWG